MSNAAPCRRWERDRCVEDQVLTRIPYNIPMSDVMERINLNVPANIRRQLREMADQAGRTESELARSLLVGALERARRDHFYRRVAEAHTPALHARDLEILRAFEHLGG